MMNDVPSQRAARDVVCGMTVDPNQAAGQEVYEGTTYYFCCVSCQAKFLREPAKYARKPSGQFVVLGGAAVPEKDPVCGMTVDPGKAAGQEVYEGTTRYFCC